LAAIGMLDYTGVGSEKFCDFWNYQAISR